MKFIDRINNVLGLGTARTAPPPEYLLVTDGLLVTTRLAIAWYKISTSNTDQESQEHVDAELQDAIASVSPILADYDCHLKIVWGQLDGEQYLESLNYEPTEWDDEHAEWLDNYEIRERHLLLGVVIDADRQADGNVMARQRAATALGLPPGKITAREQAHLIGRVLSLGKNLNSTAWNVTVADVGTLMWMISRETHRDTLLPRSDTITGASMATLTASRVNPYSDHLETLDQAGNPQRYVAVLTLSDFPMDITTGGQQEWLRRLSLITRVDGEGNRVAVTADASIRFRILDPNRALKRVEDARQLAKEQRQSAAKHSAGETSLEFQETEDEMEVVRRDLTNNGLILIEAHARLVLSEPTREDLDEAIAATISHYKKMGITATRAADEQRELWLEMLPGDQLRVADMYQVMEAPAFFGSWFWGGSAVGEAAGAPMIGYQTGSTPGIVRHSLISGSRRGDTTTTAYVGRSGRGKTTALMLGEIDAVMNAETWAAHIAIKGDELALVPFLNERGIPAGLVPLNAEHKGSADLFRSLDPDEAIAAVAQQIQLLAPDHLQNAAASNGLILVQQEAEQALAERRTPSTWRVIQRMISHDDADVQLLGRTLAAMTETRLGAPVLGEWAGHEALRAEPGLWMIQLPNLDLPLAERSVNLWSQTNKLSVAVVRAIALHSLSLSRRPELREMQKLVAIPEVHRLIGSEDGADFLNQVARMGRALGANLAIDTQDATSLAKLQGVLEQINTFFVFQLTSEAEQNAAAQILGMEANADSRATIRGLATNPDDPDEIRHGHALMRDHVQRVATVQFVIPNERVQVALNTNPDADRLRAEYAARVAAAEDFQTPTYDGADLYEHAPVG